MTTSTQSDLTRGDIARELLAGNWQILDKAVEAKLQRLNRPAAIREAHFDFMYYAGYYDGENYRKIVDSIHQWDESVGFKLE